MSAPVIIFVIVVLLVGVGEIFTKGCRNHLYCDWCCYISCLCGLPCCACDTYPDSDDPKYIRTPPPNPNDANNNNNTNPNNNNNNTNPQQQ